MNGAELNEWCSSCHAVLRKALNEHADEGRMIQQVTGINYDDLQLDSGRLLDPLLRVHAWFVLHPGVHFVPKLAERRISPPRASGQAQNSCDLPAHLPLLAIQSQLQGNDSADPTIKGFSVLVHLLEQFLLALSELLGLISPPDRDLDTISARFTLHTPNLAI